MITKSEIYYTISITIKHIGFVERTKDFNVLDFEDKEEFLEEILKEFNIKDISFIANYQVDWKYLEDFIPSDFLNLGIELDEDIIYDNVTIFDYISLLKDATNKEEVYFEYFKNYNDTSLDLDFDKADELYFGEFTTNKEFFLSNLELYEIEGDNKLINYIDYDKVAFDLFVADYNKYNNLIFRQN